MELQAIKKENHFIKQGHVEMQVIQGFLINPFTKSISNILLPAMHNTEARKERLAMMQGFVAGNIERLPWDYSIDPDQNSHWTMGNDLYANEEGLFQGWRHCFKVKGLWEHQYIFGNAIIFGADHRNGKLLSTSVNKDILKHLIIWDEIDADEYLNSLD